MQENDNPDLPNQDVLEDLVQGHGLGAGRRLREIREELGLTPEAVAMQIKLTQTTITNLEKDDYGQFSARIFVKGYLRAYAQMLGADVDDILRRFEQENYCFENERIEKVTRPTYSAADKSEVYLRWMGYVVSTVLFALVLAWWHGHKSRVDAPVKLPNPLVTLHSNETTQTTDAPEPSANAEASHSDTPSHQAQSHPAFRQPDTSATDESEDEDSQMQVGLGLAVEEE